MPQRKQQGLFLPALIFTLRPPRSNKSALTFSLSARALALYFISVRLCLYTVLCMRVCVCEWMCFLCMCVCFYLPPSGPCLERFSVKITVTPWQDYHCEKQHLEETQCSCSLCLRCSKKFLAFPAWGAGFVFDLHGRPRPPVPFQKAEKKEEEEEAKNTSQIHTRLHPTRLQYSR